MCFPQFGPWEFGPQHGFARDSDKWKVEGSGVSVDAVTGDASVSWERLNKCLKISVRIAIENWISSMK